MFVEFGCTSINIEFTVPRGSPFSPPQGQSRVEKGPG